MVGPPGVSSAVTVVSPATMGSSAAAPEPMLATVDALALPPTGAKAFA